MMKERGSLYFSNCKEFPKGSIHIDKEWIPTATAAQAILLWLCIYYITRYISKEKSLCRFSGRLGDEVV